MCVVRCCRLRAFLLARAQMPKLMIECFSRSLCACCYRSLALLPWRIDDKLLFVCFIHCGDYNTVCSAILNDWRCRSNCYRRQAKKPIQGTSKLIICIHSLLFTKSLLVIYIHAPIWFFVCVFPLEFDYSCLLFWAPVWTRST